MLSVVLNNAAAARTVAGVGRIATRGASMVATQDNPDGYLHRLDEFAEEVLQAAPPHLLQGGQLQGAMGVGPDHLRHLSEVPRVCDATSPDRLQLQGRADTTPLHRCDGVCVH